MYSSTVTNISEFCLSWTNDDEITFDERLCNVMTTSHYHGNALCCYDVSTSCCTNFG